MTDNYAMLNSLYRDNWVVQNVVGIIRVPGRELPYLERDAALYWGESEVEALYQDVVKHNDVSPTGRP